MSRHFEADIDGYDEKRHGHFKWLRKDERGATYNSFARFAHLPACSFDWGGDGYAGSSNYGGELLSLSAPSPIRGLIMARGDFSMSLNTFMARTQVEFGGPTTFGLEIARGENPYDAECTSGLQESESLRPEASLELGAMLERGCFNYRWPFNEYFFDIHRELDTETKRFARWNWRSMQESARCSLSPRTQNSINYCALRKVSILTKHPIQDQCYLNNILQNTVEDISDFSASGNTTSMIRLWDSVRGIGLEARAYQLYQGKKYKELCMMKSTADADNGPRSAQKTTITAYHAMGVFEDFVKGEPRCAVFMVVIRFFEADTSDLRTQEFVIPHSKSWSPPLSSYDVYEYIGIDPASTYATGAMWDSIVVQQAAPILELGDVSLIGRSLEKILQVDSVPATFNNLQKSEFLIEIALVSNIFIGANIDLEAMFWKVRFLVRTYKFVSRFCETISPNTARTVARSDKALHLNFLSDPSEIEAARTKIIADAQLGRIRKTIESLLRYLVMALLSSDSMTPLMPDSRPFGHLSYFYVLTTIWYVKRNFLRKFHSGWNWDWEMSLTKLNPNCPIFEQGRLPSDNWRFEGSEREQLPFLQWYHYGSMLALYQQKVISWKASGLEKKVSALADGAKIFAAAKLSSLQPYCEDDEIIDRLSFISDELGLQPRQPGQIGQIAAITIKRVKRRDNTRSLNHGWLPPGHKGTTSGPWELYMLCHHSRLMSLSIEEKGTQDHGEKERIREEVEPYKQRIYSFRNSEGTVISCWERALVKACESWLRSETTAVLASTLLNINRKYLKTELRDDFAKLSEDTPQASHNPEANAEKTNLLINTLIKHTRLNQRNLLVEMKYMENIMKDQLDIFERFIGEAGQTPPINWTAFALPRRYHPESFVDSLEDTSEKYQFSALKSTSIPTSLKGRIDTPEHLTSNPRRGFDWAYLCEHLESLGIYDISAIQSSDQANGFSRDIQVCEYDCSKQEFPRFLDNDPRWRLYDSLVDLEVQHRFLVVRKSALKKEFLNLLVYVFHPEVAGNLGNHALKLSRFSCHKGDTWGANITLRSWRVKENGNSLRNRQAQSFKDDEPIYLPDLKNLWADDGQRLKLVERDRLEKLSFELEVSSIVLSTNGFGDFSKCTILSRLIGQTEMVRIGNEAQSIWRKFIHQPQTGRCLVFFLIISEMCEKMTEEYKIAIAELTLILELNDSFNRSEEKWAAKKTFFIAFELGLWGVDSLHKVEFSLNATIACVTDAKARLMEQVQEGSSIRGKVLEKMCHEYVEIFESSLVQLIAVKAVLERRINMAMRFEESCSLVLSMRDSRTSVAQNATIQKLTYLTIVYLPLSLMAALFAIPDDQKVLFPAMGRPWFVGGIFILSAVTYIMAIYIGAILATIRMILEGIITVPIALGNLFKLTFKPAVNLSEKKNRREGIIQSSTEVSRRSNGVIRDIEEGIGRRRSESPSLA